MDYLSTLNQIGNKLYYKNIFISYVEGSTYSNKQIPLCIKKLHKITKLCVILVIDNISDKNNQINIISNILLIKNYLKFSINLIIASDLEELWLTEILYKYNLDKINISQINPINLNFDLLLVKSNMILRSTYLDEYNKLSVDNKIDIYCGLVEYTIYNEIIVNNLSYIQNMPLKYGIIFKKNCSYNKIYNIDAVCFSAIATVNIYRIKNIYQIISVNDVDTFLLHNCRADNIIIVDPDIKHIIIKPIKRRARPPTKSRPVLDKIVASKNNVNNVNNVNGVIDVKSLEHDPNIKNITLELGTNIQKMTLELGTNKISNILTDSSIKNIILKRDKRRANIINKLIN